MKKTKLLMPILGVGAVAATVAPMVAMTGCNKDEDQVGEFSLKSTNLKTESNTGCGGLTLMWNGDRKAKRLEFIKLGGDVETKDGKIAINTWTPDDFDAIRDDLNHHGKVENLSFSLERELPENDPCKMVITIKYKFVDEEEEEEPFNINATITYTPKKLQLK